MEDKDLQEYDPKDIKFGLIAIDPEEEGDEKSILHFCGYWDQPTLIEAEALRKELAEDPEFGLTEVAHRLDIFPAPDDIMEMIIKDIEENEQ